MTNKTIRVQPIHGKFVSVNINGRVIRIWLVDPDTNEQGTPVSYADALTILSLRHPVVCPAQIKDKNGKFVKQLTDEDEAKIAEMRKQNENQIAVTESVSTDDSALKTLVETQAALIKSQSEQIDNLKQSQTEMKDQMAEILKQLKKGKNKADKEEQEK